MKRFFFTLILLTAGICLHAQVDTAIATVRYSFMHISDTTQPENPLKQNMVLYIGANLSRYTTDRTASGQGLVSAGSVAKTDMVVPGASSNKNWMYSNSYYKDISTSKLMFLTVGSGNLIGVEESIPVINWTITQETKDIMNMPCQKATANFRGRNYEAWFCTKLPYSNGPWKLGGLPGLIVEAYDTKKDVVFKMTAFEQGEQTVIDVPSPIIKTTPKEYKQYREAAQRDMQVRMGASDEKMSAITMDGQPMKMRANNNPLEKQ